jgi:hypothetical protein
MPREAAVRIRSLIRLTAGLSLAWSLAGFSGCSRPATAPPPVPGGGDGSSSNPAAGATVSPASQEIGAAMNTLINEGTTRFRPLDYEYNEDLLEILDRAEADLSGKATGPPPRAMPRLDVEEEREHFRETFRRWKEKTDKDLRAEIDKLKAEVAARKPGGPAFHPDFQKRFSAAFDDLIPIEVAEIRERRNRYLHERAKAILDPYREKDPDAVREFQEVLDQPPYNLTSPEPAAAKTP